MRSRLILLMGEQDRRVPRCHIIKVDHGGLFLPGQPKDLDFAGLNRKHSLGGSAY